jgi:hypothetical protein
LEGLVTARSTPVHTLLLFPARSAPRPSGAAFRLLESDIFVFLSVTALTGGVLKVLKEDVRRHGSLLSEDDGMSYYKQNVRRI